MIKILNKHDIKFTWIKGQSKDKYNIKCDKLVQININFPNELIEDIDY